MVRSAFAKTSREIAFTKADEAAWSRLLNEKVGRVLFADGQRWASPAVPLREIIPDCESDWITALFPDADDWRPRAIPDVGHRYNVSLTKRFFWMTRGYWDWTGEVPARWIWDPPTLEPGSIFTLYRRSDTEAEAFVKTLWRLLEKFSCRQFQIEYPHLGTDLATLHPERGIGPYDPRKRSGWDTRAGADALRWCQGKPGRMISGSLRPADGWTFPEWLKPYYREEEMAETDRMTETPPEGMR